MNRSPPGFVHGLGGWKSGKARIGNSRRVNGQSMVGWWFGTGCMVVWYRVMTRGYCGITTIQTTSISGYLVGGLFIGVTSG